MSLSATQLQLTYSVLTHNQSTGAFQTCPALSLITLNNGQLTVNGQPITNPQFTSSQVNWTQLSTGSYSTGSLTVENGGMELSGIVSIGTTAQDAVSYDVWATAAPEITYQTQITTQRYPTGTAVSSIPASGWTTGMTLGISYTTAIGQSIPTPQVLFNDNDVTLATTWSIDPTTQQLELIFNLVQDQEVYCMFGEFYLSGSVTFNQQVAVPTFFGIG